MRIRKNILVPVILALSAAGSAIAPAAMSVTAAAPPAVASAQLPTTHFWG